MPKQNPAEGFPPLHTETNDYYRLLVSTYPVIPLARWTLSVFKLSGQRELLTMEMLQSMRADEIIATTFSQTTPDQDGVMATARWRGVWLRDVLPATVGAVRAMAANGNSIVLAPLEANRALLAYAMNSEVLPPEQGAPLRLIVPGSTDAVSIPWLRRLEAVPNAQLQAPQTDITPMVTVLDPPAVGIGKACLLRGYAFAGLERISNIYVRIDGSDWAAADVMVGEPGVWSRWKQNWVPHRSGNYRVEVRAEVSGRMRQIARVVRVERHSR